MPQVLAALFVAAFLAPSIAVAGQTVGTATGSIVGTVTDATGARLPRVTVAVTSDAIMVPRTTLTTDDGTYRIAALPPGEYRLSFSARGFSTLAHDVRLSLGFVATVDVTLNVATQREQVTVTRRNNVLDRQSTAIAETFDSRQLADLPTSRSVGGLFALVQALQLPNMEVGGTGIVTGSYGAYGRSNSPRHTLEGIVITGLFGSGFTLDYGSLEEASIGTGAHGAEWPTLGIQTEFVSKSGGNRYHGTLYADYQNRHWQSFNVDADQMDRLTAGGIRPPPRDANRLWLYRDVNADVGGFIVKDRLWWYSSYRDQQIEARLVNFPVKPYRTDLRNYVGKATYRIAPGHTLVAYGHLGRNHQPNRLDPFGSGPRLVAATAINESEDSTADQRNAGRVWKGEWNAVVNDRLLFDVRVGQFGTEQDWKSRSDSPRFEDIETLLVRGGNRDWHSTARRDQMFATLSYFKDDLMGSHRLTFGGEMIRFIVAEAWVSGYPGNVLHVLRNGTPSSVFLFDTPSKSESGVWTYSTYATDSWRLNDRLTVNAGLRIDGYRLFLPAQQHPAGSPTAHQFAAVGNLIDWLTVAPRIAWVYDLTGDGRTLAKVTLGRYHVAPNASVAFNSNANSPVRWTRHRWTDRDRSGVWERGEEVLPPLGSRGGVAAESLDPALQLPVANEAGAWIERELPAGIGLRTGAVWRREHQQFARQNVNQPFDAFTVPILLRDPGPDGVDGTADDGPTVAAYDLRPEFVGLSPVNIVRNVPRSTSDYWTWEIGVIRRAQGRWSLGAGFAHTWNRDHAASYSGQSVRSNAYPLTPNDLIYAGPGGRHEFTTWTAKAHGTYEIPWGLSVAPVLRHQSGQPFGRTFTTDLSYGTITVLAEPVGIRRMDNITILDVRVEKRFRVQPVRRIAGFVDLFNCLNANPVQNMVWASGRSYLSPVTILPPRIMRIGLKVDW